jgi:hypothetical protein
VNKYKLIIVNVAIFISVSALFIGCTSIDNAIKGSEYGGTVKVYPITEKQAWESAKTVFLWQGAKEVDIEENRIKHSISWPGVMMAIIDPIDNYNTRVITIPSPSPCLPMKDRPTEEDFHSRFSQAVNILKSGKSLLRPH